MTVIPGDRMLDRWTDHVVTVVAGAQPAGYTTVQFKDGSVLTVADRHLSRV